MTDFVNSTLLIVFLYIPAIALVIAMAGVAYGILAEILYDPRAAIVEITIGLAILGAFIGFITGDGCGYADLTCQ